MKKLLLALTSFTLVACSSGSPDRDFTLAPLDDAPTSATLKIEDYNVPEGASGETPNAVFRVSMAPASSEEVSVNYNTAETTATAGDDYTDVSGILVFAAGETEKFVEVPVTGDDDEEENEQFTVSLSGANGASLFDGTATGTIANDDSSCDLPIPGSPNPWMEDERKLLDFSHRGGADDYPENTIYSYKKSLEIGAEVLEMDVYENADGELIVIHDATVDRTTNNTGDVSSFTTAQLKEMDAAYWFVPSQGVNKDAAPDEYIFRGIATGERTPPIGYSANDFTIPTLEEILQLFPDELINIELKPDPDSTGSYEGKVAELVLKYGRSDDVVVASFVDNAGAAFKAAAPCISTSYSTANAAAAVAQSKASPAPVPLANPAGHHAFQVPPSLGVEVVNQKFIDDAHASNIAVHVWTINDCQQMVDLLNMGVDAIMTDRPLMLEQLLDQTPGSWTCDTVIWPLD